MGADEITCADVVELWHSFDIDTSKQLAAHLENFFVVFSYNSAAIENPKVTYSDTHEIFENGKVANYTGDLKTLYEIQNMKDAAELVCEAFDEHSPITKDLILKLHYELTKGTYDERRWELGERPGQFKQNDAWGVGMHDVSAPVADVQPDLDRTLEQVADIEDKDALTAAAFLHASFEAIHPFADGNGRVGRTLMNYLLLIHNHPPVVVHEEDRTEYYATLNSFDETGNPLELKAFLEQQLLKTWKNSVERHQTTWTANGSK